MPDPATMADRDPASPVDDVMELIGEIAGWIAPAATMIAALMTAANLGPRVTGWGFAIFAIGSVCWMIVALDEDQANLLVTNALLAAVNAGGSWRWLRRCGN